MESDDEDDAAPMVTIGDRRLAYHDVTDEMVAMMTPAEKEEYIRIGQEMYENYYEWWQGLRKLGFAHFCAAVLELTWMISCWQDFPS